MSEGGRPISITVKFWGTRGSLPTAFTQADLEARLISALAGATAEDVGDEAAAARYVRERMAEPRRYGGETTCVEFRNAGGGRILIDLGSGARVFGSANPVSKTPFSVLMSHMHWDHVQGFPFFAPAFIPGNTVRIGGGHGASALEAGLCDQFQPPYFPVPREVLRSDLSFFDIPAAGSFELEGFTVTPFLLRHTGGSYGYRLDCEGASVVFASDAEHRPEDITPSYGYVDWIRDADLLIFDGQYGLVDLVLHKEDWGHSSGLVAVDLAHLAGVPRILLTHHDPAASDAQIDGMVEDTREYLEMLVAGGAPDLHVDAAYDGLETTLG